jgi:hypothetical protein
MLGTTARFVKSFQSIQLDDGALLTNLSAFDSVSLEAHSGNVRNDTSYRRDRMQRAAIEEPENGGIPGNLPFLIFRVAKYSVR